MSVKAPAVVPSGVLKPVTASSCGRYAEKFGAALEDYPIQPGQFTSARTPEPQYLPSYWSSYVHPEGQLYFCRHLPFRVVTEEYVHDPLVMEKILYWITKVEDSLLELKFNITPEIELFLSLDGEDCKYYLVDYAAKTMFWVHTMTPNDLQIPGQISDTHLVTHLTGQFWNHVEYFPMHFGPLSTTCLDELLSIFSHGLADTITSRSSTFFYDKKDCTVFFKLLKNARDHLADGHQICLIARLWSNIYNQRYLTNYGTQYCRLDRTASILWAEPAQVKWLSPVLSSLSFNAYNTQLSRFRDLFCDRLVYQEQWRSFVTDNIAEWQHVSYKAFALLMLHIFPLPTDASVELGMASFALSCASLVSSVLLLRRFQPLQSSTSGEAHNYLTKIDSPTFGFQFAAFATVLPSAFFLWGILVFFANCLYSIYRLFGSQVSIGFCAICILILVLFQAAIGEEWSFPSLVPSFFRRRHLDRETEVV